MHFAAGLVELDLRQHDFAAAFVWQERAPAEDRLRHHARRTP